MGQNTSDIPSTLILESPQPQQDPDDFKLVQLCTINESNKELVQQMSNNIWQQIKRPHI